MVQENNDFVAFNSYESGSPEFAILDKAARARIIRNDINKGNNKKEIIPYKQQDDSEDKEFFAYNNPFNGDVEYNFVPKKEPSEEKETILDYATGQYITVNKGQALPKYISETARRQHDKQVQEEYNKAHSVLHQSGRLGKRAWNLGAELLGSVARFGYEHTVQAPERARLAHFSAEPFQNALGEYMYLPDEIQPSISEEDRKKEEARLSMESGNFSRALVDAISFDEDGKYQIGDFAGDVLGSVMFGYIGAGWGVGGAVVGAYGLNQYYDTIDFLMSKGIDFDEARKRALVDGWLEFVMEKISLDSVLRVIKGGWRAPMKRVLAPAAVEGGTEWGQTAKTQKIREKYDDRTPQEKDTEQLMSAFGGILGGIAGGNYNYYKVYSATNNYLQSKGFSKADSEAAARDVALGLENKLVNEIENTKFLSPEQIKRGQEFIEEAQRKGGKDADTYVNIMNTYKQVGKLGGFTEEEIRKNAEYFANAHTSLFLALKDKNPNFTYEQYADKIKLNSLRIIQDINIEREVNKRVKETLPWFGETSELTAEQVDEVERVAQNERFNVMREAGLIKEDDTLYSRVGYASMRTPLSGKALSTSHYGEGEGGTMTHGWGNYVLFDPILNKWFYYDEWSGVNRYVYYKGDKPYGVIREIIDGDTTKEKAIEDINKLINESKQIIAENKEKIKDIEESYPNGLDEGFQSIVNKYQEEIETEKDNISENEKTLQEVNDFDESEVEVITYYPKMKYDGKEIDSHKGTKANLMWHFFEENQTKEQFDEAIKDELDRIKRRLERLNEDLKLAEEDLSPSEIEKAKNTIKKAKKHSDILDKGEALEHLFGEDKAFSQYKDILWDIETTKKYLDNVKEVEKLDFSKVEKYTDAQQWSVEVPDVEFMLQEDEPYSKQSLYIRDALDKLNTDLQFPKQKEKTFKDVKEAESFYKEQEKIYEEKANGFERFMPKIIDNPDGTFTIKYSDKFDPSGILDELRVTSGEAIYNRLTNLLGSKKAASEKLLEYGIKGIDYFGGRDKHGAVIFEDVPVIERLLSRYNASYSDAKKIIRLFKGHNPQALVHELSHNFFMDYFKLTEEYGLTEKNKAIYDMLGKKSYKEFGEKEWETITEEFMKYLKTNESPNIALSGLFRRAKDWLIETFFTTNKSETPSPEVKEFFDNLVKDEYGTVDATSLRMTPRTFKEIIKDIKSGKEVSFQGVRRSDLQALRKILHQARPRKAKTLAEEMRKDDMRIKADSELAKQLGYDPKKKQPMFDKNGTIERIDELDDYLVEKGLLEPNQAETAEQVSDRENKIENIINQAEDIYSAEEQTYADYRDIVEQNQLRVSELVDDILKDNELGIKDIDEINEYLDKAIAMAKKVDSVLVNKEAIKFLVEGYENAEKLYNKTLKELQKAQDVIGVRQQLTDYIRSLPLTAKHRLSLMTKVKQINKGDDFTEVLGNINDSFKRMWEQETKEILANNINEILKSTKPKERRKQKYNFDYNTLFEELRTINDYTGEKVSKAYEDILNEVRDSDSADYVETDEDREINDVKRMLVSYKMNGRKGSSIALMKRLESELFKLRQDAIEDKVRTETEKAIKKKAEIARAVGYIKKHKKVGKVLGFYLKNTNLYSNEAELFGKDWAKAHEMETIELEQNRKVKAKTKEMIEKGKKIYGIPDDTGSKKMFKNSDKEFARIINEKSQENFTLHGVNGKAQNLERKISLLQIMDIYNTIKNKNSADIYSKLYETFDEEGNQTSHQIQGLIDNLSEQDKAFADAIMADIQSLRDSENEIYVKLYGIDMPKHEPYYPRSAERVEGELMDIKKFAIGDDTPSFFKERAKMSLLVPRNMWTKYQSRINDSMYMTNTFEKYKEHYDLIHNSDVKNAIEAKYDTKRYMSLNTSLKDLSLSGNNKAFDDMENFMSNLVSNWVVSKIALNDAVFTKQLLSMTNFIENMPVADFFKYSMEMLTNPKKAFDFMQKFDGAYLKQRFTDGMQNEALAQIMANAERSVKKRDYIFQDYIDFVTLPVRLGDVGAIYLGGYARVRYLLEHGTPIKEARRIFEFEAQQSQQSGLKASMAQFQKNTIFRFFTAFKNTQLQYLRKMLDGFIQWRRGEIDTKHYAKILGNYAFLQAFMYQVATNIFSYWRDDDDDKEFDWSKDVAMQIITSPVAGVPLLGDMAQNLLKKQSYDLGIAGLQDANKAIRLAKKSFNDLIEGEFDPKTAEKAGALMLQFVKPMPANILTTILND